MMVRINNSDSSTGSKKLTLQNKWIVKELNLLKNLNNEHFLYGKIEKEYGIVIPVEINAVAIKSKFLGKEFEKLHFEIRLTDKFPF